MDPSDVENLKKAFGSSVSRYLEDSTMVQKTFSGAFVISPYQFLKCEELILSDKAKKIEKITTSIVKDGIGKFEDKLIAEEEKLSADQSKNATEFKKFVNFEDSPVATWVTIYFRKKTKWKSAYVQPIVPRQLNFSESIKQRSKLRYTGLQLFELMMKSKIGRESNTDYNACLKDIELILVEFQERHLNYPYHRNLQKILNTKGHKKCEDQFEITVKQYQLFVYKIIAEVIPKSLFGCNKNEKILRKALRAYYESRYKVPIDLKPYIHRLDISKIEWLQKIKHPKTRLSVIAKVTKWLYEHFFLGLFKTVFNERRALHDEKRVMMSAEKWNKLERNLIDCALSEGRLVKVNPKDIKMLGKRPGKMMLIPKATGVRPVFRIRRNQKQKRELKMLKTLLQQLYLNTFRVMRASYDKNLHAAWLPYAESSKESTNRKVNIVTCDVADAFGSIIQEKLADILNAMINAAYEILPWKWYEILVARRTRRLKIIYKQFFSCWPVTLSARAHSLIAISRAFEIETQYVRAENVRRVLTDFIFGQYVSYGSQMYNVRLGIVQGSPLSPILAEIYYQQMTVQEFGIFMQSGTLLRYVDDYIYITDNENSARRFLNRIKKNVPEYNCRFKKTKIQTNIKSRVCKKSERVTYLGYELNGATLETCPAYGKREFKYARCLKFIPRTFPMIHFKALYLNMICLKLKQIVLDSRINSLNRLRTIAGRAAKIMAMRCAAIILKYFKDANEYRDQILGLIRIALKRIEVTFREHLSASDRKKWPSFQTKIRIALWQSYFRVFTGYPHLREVFCKEMKTMIKNQTFRYS